jgi:hypothetical protein
VKIALLAIALAGCKKVEAPSPTPVALDVSGSWQAVRTGDAPVLRSPGGTFVYVLTAADDRVAGLGIGTEAGPELGLLDGKFAPLLIPVDPIERVQVGSTASTLAIDFAGAFKARVTASNRIRLVIDGRANVVLPAGETMVKGFLAGAPRFAEKVTAWSEASDVVHRVDRIEVDTERRGTIVVESPCAPRLIRPRALAHTSSFLLGLGPCARSSTVTVDRG